MLKIVVLLCVVLQLSVAQTPAHVPCTSDHDCGADQCCVASIFSHDGRRRRFILDEIFGHHHGHCMAMAQEGHTCEPDMNIFGGSQTHSLGCPCAAGLECHGDRETHNGNSHSYINPKCMPAGSYTGAVAGGTTPLPPDTTVSGVNPTEPILELPGK